ncbi:polyprenyl synthetase family protein [Nonomuraea sp. NPDC000554]|uniref:polyprenyl synthetase family protein n=1 Tax=Nonomuraea sp. NPDC000554 TaxID=3154259 RepID=UPI003327240D
MSATDEAASRDSGRPAYTEHVVARLRELASGLPEPLGPVVRDLAGRPGKCLRSSLLAACAGASPAVPSRLVRLGALVELLHMASLLHDDVVDRAPLRRGGPAAHTVVGAETAMLAGLACFSLAGTESAQLGPGVAAATGRTVAGLAYGELLDVERAFDTALGLDDYVELVERKTGELFRLACLLGAAEAALEPEEGAVLGRFGLGFGVAFQILDDCLDLSTGEVDKAIGTDHVLGLFGAPTLLALRADVTGELGALLLAPDFGRDDVPKARSLIISLGGLDQAEDLARERYARATAELAQLADDALRSHVACAADAAWGGFR